MLGRLARRKQRLARLLEHRRRELPQFDYAKACHAKQGGLVASLVLRQSRYLAVLAGRQSGKSHGATLGSLLIARQTPNVAVIYVTSTDATVRKMAYEPAKRLNRELKLGGRPVSSPSPVVSFPNGSVVYFIGADSDKTIQRLRGTPNLILCIIDECGLYDSEKLRQMIEAVTPGLRPLSGALVLMGTPSLQGPQGTFWEATVNERFEQHRFSYLDNDRVPSFADVERLIDEELAVLGYTRSSAYFLREYLCQFVVELAERVYQLTEANYYDVDPPGNLETFVVGGDVGVSDSDALLSLGWRKDSPLVWVDDEQEASGQDALEFSINAAALNEKRRPICIAVDPGGGGMKTILTVKRMNPAMPIRAAEKPPIPIQVRAVNMLAQSARLKVRRGSQLAIELARATWRDGLVGGDIDEHGHSDLVPCLRYACLTAMPYLPPLDAHPDKPDVAAKKREWADVVAQAQRVKKSPGRMVDSLVGRRQFPPR